jgi:branched-chain amino acid transport system ATP-binding protein
MKELLKVTGLKAGYGGLLAVENATLVVHEGELVTLLGPNGAGKSTTLKAISGLIPLQGGTVELDGARVSGKPPHEIARRGIRLVPEGRWLFPALTVQENLLMGAYLIPTKDRQARIDQALDVFPMLKERLSSHAGQLSGGQAQMLAIARGMVGNPRILMMDEPSLGLAPIVQEQVREAVVRLSQIGISILIVEQNVTLALSIATRGYVMRGGRCVTQGTAKELMESHSVRSEYLGGAAAR